MTARAEHPNFDSELRAFCLRWKVSRLWLFGSLARGDARPESDADLIVEFADDSATSTWDWPAMQDELRAIFNRDIDLLSTGVLTNKFRRASIEATRRLLYAA